MTVARTSPTFPDASRDVRVVRAGTAPAFERRSQGDDGYHEAWQSALEDTPRTWCARISPHGSEKNRLKKYLGQ
jgi:hypothetical protein